MPTITLAAAAQALCFRDLVNIMLQRCLSEWQQQSYSKGHESFPCRSASHRAKCHVPGTERDSWSQKFYGCGIWLCNNSKANGNQVANSVTFLPASRVCLLALGLTAILRALPASLHPALITRCVLPRC